MRKWVALYEHRFGSDVLPIKSNVEPSIDEVVATYDEVDFDLDREDEWLTIYAVDDSEFRTVVPVTY